MNEKEEEAERTCSGEGDASRLINRHADNHSGFMVTTDYQVVQGGIFHIRDVTLFQWGNTCFARYKLHERAYTGRHVCCIANGNALAKANARVCAPARVKRTGSREEASRYPFLSRTTSSPIPFPRGRVSKSFPRSATTKMPGHFSERTIP